MSTFFKEIGPYVQAALASGRCPENSHEAGLTAEWAFRTGYTLWKLVQPCTEKLVITVATESTIFKGVATGSTVFKAVTTVDVVCGDIDPASGLPVFCKKHQFILTGEKP